MSRPGGASIGSGRDDGDPAVTRQVMAEAAVWVARLHGPDRSKRMEQECQAWQAQSAAHRLAFEKCTDTWQDVALVSLGDAFAAGARDAPRGRGRAPSMRWAVGVALAGLCAAVGIGIQQWRDEGRHRTGVGEQQLVVLEDGSRVSLNTASRIQVSLGSSQRLVTVEAGEALFEVAKDPQRPFVVLAAGNEVVAVGTTFVVRVQEGPTAAAPSLAVTLVEGKVTVRRAAGPASATFAAPAGSAGSAAPVTLQAGERVSLSQSSGDAGWTQKLDRPRIESVLAWKHSLVSFDDVSLADAVSEMNRYSRTPIVLLEPDRLASLRVSGDFQTSDTAGFARAVATLHELKLDEARGRLELSSLQ
jgi:transmembrane sensor